MDWICLLFLFPLLGFFEEGKPWYVPAWTEIHAFWYGIRYSLGLFKITDVPLEDKPLIFPKKEHYFWAGVVLMMLVYALVVRWVVGGLIDPAWINIATIAGFFGSVPLINQLLGRTPNPFNENYGKSWFSRVGEALASVWDLTTKPEATSRIFNYILTGSRILMVVTGAISVLALVMKGQVQGDVAIGTIKSLLDALAGIGL